MSDISQIKLPNNNVYDIKDAKKTGVYTVIGTQTAATASWTGELHGVSALFDGLTINYYLPYAGVSSTNVTLNLTLDSGATTGAKNCYISTSRLTTHYGAGRTIVMTYYSAGSISIAGTATTDDRWICDAYYDTNSDTKVRQTLASGNADRPLLMSYADISNTTTNVDNVSYRNNSIFANPSTGTITATKFSGDLIGNADTATNALTVSGHTVATDVPSGAVFTDTKVTSTANHYTPATATGSDLSASASGGTAAWSIDVVQGVTLNTDSKGHVTGISVTSGKIPANPNSDTKVRQTLSTTNKNYPLLLSYGESSDTTANIDNISYRANAIYANPSTGNIHATKLNGVDIGSSPKFTDTDTKVTAVGNHYTPSGGSAKTPTGDTDTDITNLASGSGTQVISGVTVDAAGHITGLTSKKLRSVDTTYANGTGITIGNGNAINHTNSVTAQTTQAVYPIKIDAQGHISAYGTSPTTLSGYGITDAKIASGVITLGSNTITPLTASSTLDATKLSGTIPSGCYTDTKNTAGSTDTSSKIFLIGATSQAANPQTYSDDEVYTTSGVLTTKSVQVGGGSASLVYDANTQAIDFIFS